MPPLHLCFMSQVSVGREALPMSCVRRSGSAPPSHSAVESGVGAGRGWAGPMGGVSNSESRRDCGDVTQDKKTWCRCREAGQVWLPYCRSAVDSPRLADCYDVGMFARSPARPIWHASHLTRHVEPHQRKTRTKDVIPRPHVLKVFRSAVLLALLRCPSTS